MKDLTPVNVWDLTEEGAFRLTEKIMTEIAEKEERNSYIKIISAAFEFRTVSKSKKALIRSLELLGYQFFSVENEKTILRGICKRRKSARSSI